MKVKQANPVLCTLLPPAQLDHQHIVRVEASGVPVETFHAVDPKSFDSHALPNTHQDLLKYARSSQKACKMENCSSPSSLAGLGQAESCRVANTDRLSNLTAATSLPGRVASSAVIGMNTGMKTGLMAIGGVLALSLAIAQQANPQESAWISASAPHLAMAAGAVAFIVDSVTKGVHAFQADNLQWRSQA
jgi:hypothetical protein